MKLEKEITVIVETDYKTLHSCLTDKGFNIKEKYQLNDIYMIDKNINIKEMNKLDILQKCILVRDIVGIEKQLLYKLKKYDNNGDILEQGKVKCSINNIDEAIFFMETINYRKIFSIKDECIVYINDNTELVVQLVNDKYIFIEMEDQPEYINKKYSSLQEMKEELELYNLPYRKDNYFVKKAEIILGEIL